VNVVTTNALKLGKYSIGVGDRFARQAQAQLRACIMALARGVEVIPVWNKSNREHTLIGSEPCSARQAADSAVQALHWRKPYFCDADHITLQTVDRFIESCDFYTIDVADSIGQPSSSADVEAFVKRHPELLGRLQLEGVSESFEITREDLRLTAQKFLAAVKKSAEVCRKIEIQKGPGKFIPEISMDETDRAQTPVELLIILAAIADEGIPIQTIAPKFSGRFNKGVDYVGDVAKLEQEMALDVAAIGWAIRQYDLPENLKLSIHSGSDKFSIYPCVHRTMKRFNTGVHLKTAGTTWLEELIGLAEAGGEGLALAKDIYAEAFRRQQELCAPYATVIEIRRTELPSPEEVHGWSSEQYTSALRHIPESASYNLSFRQLLHVAFKIAAQMGNRYLDLLRQNAAVIARNVTENLYARHIAPVFLGASTREKF
jgi:tagaturonate epimerase